MVHGEVGRQSVTTFEQKRMTHFWIHLTEGKQSKLSNIMFILMKSLHDSDDFK